MTRSMWEIPFWAKNATAESGAALRAVPVDPPVSALTGDAEPFGNVGHWATFTDHSFDQ